jgi:hypothetical protein
MGKPMKTCFLKELLICGVLYLSCSSQSQAPMMEEMLPSGEQIDLFDGESLDFWDSAPFLSSGKIEIRDGAIILHQGEPLSGIVWNGLIRQMNYELALEAKRIAGEDFFFGVTFPFEQAFATLLVGGDRTGLCCINGLDAPENGTAQSLPFENERWYAIRLRITDNRIQAWVDEKAVVDLDTTDKQLALRDDLASSKPLAIMTRNASAAVRNIVLTLL